MKADAKRATCARTLRTVSSPTGMRHRRIALSSLTERGRVSRTARPEATTRLAVVRALHLGDLLCAVPALRALRAGHSEAEITLIGLPWARELVPLIAPYVDRFEEFPSFPGIPERALEPARVTTFLARAQRQPWDLVVQLHGSGSHINEFVALLGARCCAGFQQEGDVTTAGGRFIPWPTSGTEAQRLLALPLALGCPDRGDALELFVPEAARRDARELVRTAGLDDQPYACVHPGARFPSRRWPAERFAAVADVLVASGLRVVLTGTSGEAAVTRAVAEAMHSPAVDLTGRLSLATLAAVVQDAALVLCNDTGMSHVAAAVGTRSVVVASGSEVARWAPHAAARHRVLWHDRPCRPCLHEVCPTGHECALGVGVAAVVETAHDLLHAEVLHA
jgi:ADP-heptose:LPS heptosyltransferase